MQKMPRKHNPKTPDSLNRAKIKKGACAATVRNLTNRFNVALIKMDVIWHTHFKLVLLL